MKTQTNQVYVGRDGQVTCFDHAGYSLQFIAMGNPNDKVLFTDLNVWTVSDICVEEYIFCQDCNQ